MSGFVQAVRGLVSRCVRVVSGVASIRRTAWILPLMAMVLAMGAAPQTANAQVVYPPVAGQATVYGHDGASWSSLHEDRVEVYSDGVSERLVGYVGFTIPAGASFTGATLEYDSGDSLGEAAAVFFTAADGFSAFAVNSGEQIRSGTPYGSTSFPVGSAGGSVSLNSAALERMNEIAQAGGGTFEIGIASATGVQHYHSVNNIALRASTAPTTPSVTQVAPGVGPSAGGTQVTITGVNFTGATAVTFSGTPATAFTVQSATRILATLPAHAAGSVVVRVTTPEGVSAPGGGTTFTYVAAPAVTALSVAAGPTAGANTVVITGTALTGATAVNFGGSPAASFVVNSATQITAVAPAGTGQVQVRVTTPGGTSAEVGPAYYSYVSAPTLTDLSPDSGSTAGGTRVELTGSNFFDTTAVNFGGVAGSDRAVFSDSQMFITAPAGAAGVVDVQVVSPGGSATLSNAFTYVEPASTDASLSALSLSSGTLSPAFATGTTSYVASVGNATTALTSTAFVSEGSATLTVNGVSVTNGQASGAIALAVGANVITTVVTAGDGTTNRTYTVTVTRAAAAPVLYGMSRGEGAADAGTPPANVTFTGINFSASGNTVTFGGDAGEIVSESTTVITVTPPARAAGGLVNMVVTTADNRSVTASNAYRYLLAPTVTVAFSPDTVNGSQYTTLTLTVSNPNDVGLQGVQVRSHQLLPSFRPTLLGDICTASYSMAFNGNFRVDVGTLAPGAVCTHQGMYAPEISGAFQFVTAAPTSTGTATTPVALTGVAATSNTITVNGRPSVTTVSPNVGPQTGGQSLTLTGTNFIGATGVTFDGVPATSFTVDSATSMTVETPASAVTGAVAVSVTGPGGIGSRPNGYEYRAAPTTPVISSPADGAATTARPVYSGTFTNQDSTITVFVDGVSVGTVTPVSGVTWSLQQPTDLADGAHTVRVTATTPEGGTSAESAATSFTVDGTAPAVPQIYQPSEGQVVSGLPGLFGVADPESFVTVVIDGVDYATVQASAQSQWTMRVTGAPLSDGAHTVAVRAADALGNTSATSAVRNFTVDTVAPVAPVVSAPTPGQVFTSARPTLTGSAEPDTTLLIYFDGGASPVPAFADDAGAWSYTHHLDLADGDHSVRLVVADAAGNTSPGTTVDFTIDSTAPVAPVILTPAEASASASRSVVVSGTAEPNATVLLVLDGATQTITADNAGRWTYTATNLTEGGHSASAQARDAGGLTSAVSALRAFTVDVTAPPAPTIIAPAEGSISGAATVVVNGTAEAGSEVEVSLDGARIGAVTADGSGAWSLDVGTPAPGVHSLQVLARDAAGNESTTATASFTYSVLELEGRTLPSGQVAAAYEATITPQAGTAPFIFDLASGALPDGLTLSVGGVIDGVPTEGGAFTAVIRVTDAAGGAGQSATFTLEIAAPVIAVTPVSLPQARFQTAYSQTLSASGGVAPYMDWRITDGALPAGLTLSSSGVISGTPTAFGDFEVIVAVTDSSTGEGPYDGTRRFALTVETPALPVVQNAELSVAYNAAGTDVMLDASGLYDRLEIGTQPGHGSASLTGDVATYTPETGYFGQDSFTVIAVGPGGNSAPATVSVTIAAPPPPEVTPVEPVDVPVTPGAGSVASVDLGGQVAGVVDGFRITAQARNGQASIESGSPPSTAQAMPTAAASAVRYRLVYRPRPDFMGVDEVSIVAFGPGGESSPTVFTFHAPGQAPDLQAEVAADGSMVFEPTADLVGGPFSGVRIITPPAFGEAQVQGLSITFTPGEANAGATYLEYVVELPFGDSAPGRIDLVALAVVETQALTAETLAGVPVTVRITDDVRGGPFTEATVVSVSPAEAGEATVQAAGPGVYDLTYTPLGAFSGEAVVTYTLANGDSTATSTLTVTVEPRPDPSLDPDVRGLAGSQVTTARRFADAQINNFQRRLETLRHGDNPSGNGVTLNVGFGRDQGQDPRAALARQLGSREMEPGARQDAERAFMGQDLWAGRRGANTDVVGATPAGAPAGLSTQPDAGREEGGPSVGVWTAGSIDWGRQNADGQRDQRFRTQGLTIGVDAHLTDRLIVGGGVGYGRDRSEIGENGTLSRGRSLTGAVYGSWRITDAVFLDGVAGRGDLAFDSRRWAVGLGGEPDAFAVGERDGSVRFVSGTIGRMADEGGLRRSLYLRVDARTIELDAFTETGAGLASLSWDALEQDSLSASVGVAWNWRIDLGERGGLSPYARVEWSRELERLDEQGVRYADWAASPTYWVPMDAWSRDSLSLNLGAEWTLRDRLMFSAGYRGQLGDASQSHGGEFSLRWSW